MSAVEIYETLSIDPMLKAPVCCFMGHVDAGKTSLMDMIRNTSLQEKEAGGITQSIGSSFVNIKDISKITENIKGKYAVKHQIPGFLIVDTPGHQAFSNLRERGSSLCDLGILVIDINEGLQPQTIESIKLLKDRKVPFVIAATKIDRIYNWKDSGKRELRKCLKAQDKDVAYSLESYISSLKDELKGEGIKSEFYFKNKKPESVYSIIPISCHTKEGLADILSFIVYLSQNWMSKKITYKDKVKATIMESTQQPKIGWVLDVILSNGTLNVGDKFAVATRTGSAIITVRNLLLPSTNPRKKGWSVNPSIRASAGVRIIASNLSSCYAGTKLHPVTESEDDALTAADNELEKFWHSFDFSDDGVYLQAQTLGELDAAYKIFSEEKIPIKGATINMLTKRDVDKMEMNLEKEKDKEKRCILYFGEIPSKNKEELNIYTNNKNIKLIDSLVIYHLVEEYKKYKDECVQERTKELTEGGEAIFPCKLRILKDHIYMNGGTSDLLIGVRVLAGTLHKGTPIILPSKKLLLGRVTSIQKNHKEQDEAKKNQEVCIRLVKDSNIMFGRHFDHKEDIVSSITRESIDILKKDFRDKMTKPNWMLIIDIMKLLDIKTKRS